MLALGPPRQALDPEVAAPKNWSGSLSSRRGDSDGDGDGDVDEAARLGPDGRKYITNSGKRRPSSTQLSWGTIYLTKKK